MTLRTPHLALALLTLCLAACAAEGLPSSTAASDKRGTLQLGETVAVPVAVPELDRLGIPYTVERTPVLNDEMKRAAVDGHMGKFVFRVRLGRLSRTQFDAVKGAYGNVASNVSHVPEHEYYLSDLLWPVAQALAGRNVPMRCIEFNPLPGSGDSVCDEVVDVPGKHLPIGFAQQTNCWSTVFEILRDDPEHFNVFQNSVEGLLDWFRDERYSTRTALLPEEEHTEAEVRAALEEMAFGDVIVVAREGESGGSQTNGRQPLEPYHAAIRVGEGWFFERSGGATQSDVYRLLTTDEFMRSWYNGSRHYETRTFHSKPADPRYTLDFSQATEGFYAFTYAQQVEYGEGAGGIRTLDTEAIADRFVDLDVFFSDLEYERRSPHGYTYPDVVDQFMEITALANDGIVTGCTRPAPGSRFAKYCPLADVTRAEAAVLLMKSLARAAEDRGLSGALDVASASRHAFPDVAGHWIDASAPAGADFIGTNRQKLNWLQENGLVAGYRDGTFRPNRPVSRAELTVMLRKGLFWFSEHVASVERDTGLYLHSSQFSDGTTIESHWARDEILEMTTYCRIAHPLVDDDPVNLDPFAPNQAATRADAARFFYRFLSCLR